ncbi:I78 family peptidase inhibitor [Sphingomonas sp. Leaf4]|uniref:I78 family peptidase inhibitor n=1 Tax=Sphingomonas sp. Leaf4 TaxID=2876553 RepID=UPI001E2D905D|nr:I78 family peptidase inhibitor [Sphingomonas sp. Leaf4]
MKRVALIGLMLVGCAPSAPDAPPPPPRRVAPPQVVMPPVIPPPPGDESAEVQPMTPCRIAAAAGLIGKPLTPAVQAEAQAKVGARSVRVIGPDHNAITMDYRPDRLNIELDPSRKILRLRCG